MYLDAFVRRFATAGCDLVEWGCGTGQNIWRLRQLDPAAQRIRRIFGFDPHLNQDLIAQMKFLAPKDVISAESQEFKGKSFQIAVAMDVLEHIEDEQKVLSEWKAQLMPGGYIFITVPAFRALWSEHDERLGHYRRYTAASLNEVMRRAGFEVVQTSYIFKHLWVPVFLLRKILKKRGAQREEQDLKLPHESVNKAMRFLGYLDFLSQKWLRLPGTSVCGVFRVPS